MKTKKVFVKDLNAGTIFKFNGETFLLVFNPLKESMNRDSFPNIVDILALGIEDNELYTFYTHMKSEAVVLNYSLKF